jgi:hypothetical protein
MLIKRFESNPLIRPQMDGRMGSNINGPSVIRVPDWATNPLGRYYLYFAHHEGEYIRLAYADDVRGPWRIYTPGVLELKDSYFDEHIASPEVRVRPERGEVWMYYHGCRLPDKPHQFQRVAVSRDGLNFKARPEVLGTFYWRTFKWRGQHYALAMPGKFYRLRDGLTCYEEGPTLFTPDMRHAAVRLTGDTLQVFYTNADDCPERILLATIELRKDWMQWRCSDPVTVLEPEMEYESGALPLEPSGRGGVYRPVRQLRDPAIFEEEGRTYLFYSVAGEHGIAGAEIRFEENF